MMPAVLITGHAGFLGTRLQTALSSSGFKAVLFEGDITDFKNVQEQLSKSEFDSIVHLAGISNVKDCEENPAKAVAVNVQGTAFLLEALVRLKRKARFVFASTGQVYHIPEGAKDVLLNEQSPVAPPNYYAKTKWMAEAIISQYFSSFDIGNAVVLRLFNHSHSSQTGPFFFPSLYRSILAKKGSVQKESIPVGNLELFRDFSSVDDLIALLLKVLVRDLVAPYSVFNVSSGQTRKLRDLAEALAANLEVNVEFQLDPSRLRSDDPYLIKASSEKAQSVFNWKPHVGTDAEYIQSFLKP
ncbi:GDP-mannose 4,6-dehydratase [Bdellovibrio sp. SKB1291214]|uniref:NAD-dependent epimerase/dehydratase family protein n=1 Tax=Bdellovibrio sp. SKB1291214 TaxID=1732569 RepID=UPI000B51892D|nr:GDP-mannose 4,6-dehydratase [Bdellovibrio sp. SKB1291214]UYL08291.1 GDP-mannose 4,6-dehydratase [Bdellovibrio sp. SKB1291214]